MKKESIIVLFSVAALAACSNDEGLLSAEEASGADDTRVDSEQNEAIENTNENDDNKDENEEENESNSVENNDEDESVSDSPSEEETNDNAEGSENEEDQAAEDNVGMTAEEIIENAIAAEAQLDSYSLEWTYHDVAEDGTVQEARDYEIQRYFANADGVDYFYRQLTGVDEEENPLTMYEAQTPEARTVYRDVDEVVVLMEPEDQTVPTVSRYDLQSLLDDDGYVLTYEGVFEIGGYETHHVNAVTEENNVEMNFWFDTDTGLQVRQNSFYAGLDGQVSILTNIETGTDFNESEYIVDAPSSVPVQDER